MTSGLCDVQTWSGVCNFNNTMYGVMAVWRAPLESETASDHPENLMDFLVGIQEDISVLDLVELYHGDYENNN